MCGLIEGIADQVCFLKCIRTIVSPRAPVFLSLHKLQKSPLRNLEQIFLTLLSHPHTIIHATQNVLVNLYKHANEICSLASVIHSSTLPLELINKWRITYSSSLGNLCWADHRNSSGNASLWTNYFHFLINRSYIYCINCSLLCYPLGLCTCLNPRNLVICILLSKWNHLGLNGRRWSSAGGLDFQDKKGQQSKVSGVSICIDISA